MRISAQKKRKSGYISFLLVLSTGAIMLTMMAFAYRRSLTGNQIQTRVQLRLDYQEKEESVLRSIVAITPNRAILAMQKDSDSLSKKNPLRWQNIFSEALTLANAGTSVPSNLAGSLSISNLVSGNSGDSSLSNTSKIFAAIPPETGYISAGINRSLGTGYPPALTASDFTTASRDMLYPIISSNKVYGTLAQSGVGLPVATYPNFNLLTYPQINFGYAKPGDPLVAKRNWWAFSVDIADHDDDKTKVVLSKRNYVLSLYEIPSQLAISASSFMSLGKFESGESWQNVTISGGVFAGKAQVEGDIALSALASRRSMTFDSGTSIGGQSFQASPFTPGVRESYQLTQGDFFPVSLASESGRAAFIPINRGADYFDRFSHTTETDVLSTTTWNNYSVGALQCAMQLDITKRASATDSTPTEFKFRYKKAGVLTPMTVSLTTGAEAGLPAGYIYCAAENGTHDFGTNVVDVAYGKGSTFAFQSGVTGSITFDNARFGDPLVGTVKAGYYRPSYPFEVKNLDNGKKCVAVYPERFKSFLSVLGADSLSVNHSLVVNVDYITLGTYLTKPSIPCTELDYGVILEECDDLTSFPKGFSLVTNLRLYIGDDFNSVAATPPSGYTPTATYYPPCSLFAPEKRYGVETDPFAVTLKGQIGSLASETNSTPSRPLDSKVKSGATLGSNRITANLNSITHPADLPPITMMNWLLVLEERRKEYY
jgi:hypothetical protein